MSRPDHENFEYESFGPAHEPEAFSPENLSAVDEIPPPVELELRGSSAGYGRTLVSLALVIVLLVTLLLQYSWRRMEDLSQHDAWRPWYSLACGIGGCDLPPRQDIGGIRSERLDVRSHSSVEEALQVNLVFRNQAEFQQPFPALTLEFSDSGRRPVARRRFQPEEYLPPELQTLELMPINSPVRIELEILDPGSDAVNYQISFGAS